MEAVCCSKLVLYIDCGKLGHFRMSESDGRLIDWMPNSVSILLVRLHQLFELSTSTVRTRC